MINTWAWHSVPKHRAANGEEKLYVGSADWMPRNLFRRIEVVFPVQNTDHKARIIETILGCQLGDNVKARICQTDGTYLRAERAEDEPAARCQQQMIDLVRETAIKSDPYEETIKAARTRKRSP